MDDRGFLWAEGFSHQGEVGKGVIHHPDFGFGIEDGEIQVSAVFFSTVGDVEIVIVFSGKDNEGFGEELEEGLFEGFAVCKALDETGVQIGTPIARSTVRNSFILPPRVHRPE